MKTPEEFKKNLVACMDEAIEVAKDGDAHDLLDFAHHAHAHMAETLTYIQRYSQVSKALCGNENASLDELLQAVEQVKQSNPGEKLICQIAVDGEEILRKALDKTEVDGKTLAEWIELAKGYEQLKAELATAERERDALLEYLTNSVSLHCDICKYEPDDGAICCQRLRDLKEKCFEWRGVCPENTGVQDEN